MSLFHRRAAPALGGADGTRRGRRAEQAPVLSRHPADLLRLAAGLIGFGAVAAAAGSGRPAAIERDVFRLINHLPDWVTLPLLFVMQAGAVGAVAVTAGASFLTRRYRLGFAFLIGGALAQSASVVFKAVVDRGRPGNLLSEVVVRGHVPGDLGFPSGHVATVAALATIAAPYLSRPLRRAAWVTVGLVALARVDVGAHLPLDVLGGIALGWAVGSAVNLVGKTPTGVPQDEQVRNALAELGFSVCSLRRVALDARASSPFLVETSGGRMVFVKFVSREQRNADLLWKLWRYTVYREVEDEVPFASPKQQVEHEAYLALLGARAGVRVPSVLVAGVGQDGSGVLVLEGIQGRSLEEVAPEDVPDTLLEEAWRQVLRLRDARIAHRDLRSSNLLLDDAGDVWVVDFGFAEAAATARRLNLDASELLASLALLVGAPRAVASAARVVGAEVLGQTLPFLQPLALMPATRQKMRSHPQLLGELRRAVAQAAGTEPPPLEPLVRWRWRSLLGLAGGLFAVHLLLPQLAELPAIARVVRTARWEWLAAAAVASAMRYPMAALSMVAALERPIGLGRATAAQVASSWANRAAPAGLGGLALKERFLERSGVERQSAIGALATAQLAGFVVHVLALLAVGGYLGRNLFEGLRAPHRWAAVSAIAVGAALAGGALWLPVVRSKVARLLRGQRHALSAALRSPGRAAALFGGAAGVNLGNALALAASLHAFGGRIALVKVIAVYLGGSAVASASPTPGGLGVIEAALVAGLSAFGVAAAPAVAGVLGFRLLTYWITIIPGFVTFRVLRRRKLL
jgi:glycosyltransferase 2 family protein